MFGRGVIDYLNTYGHSLDVTKEQDFKIIFDPYWYKGKIILKSLPMQLDNDLDIELLLLMHQTDTTVSEKYSENAYIPVNITAQNTLQIIPNNFMYEYTNGCRQVDIAHDLNHDKQNDILFYCDGQSAYSRITRQIVFGWNEEGVFRIGETESVIWTRGEMPYEVDIADVDSDGFDEIIWRIPCDADSRGNCGIVNTFSWPDIQGNLHESTVVPIIFPACDQLESPFILNYETTYCFYQLQRAVLAQTNPNIPTKITELLNYLPTDDPEARPYRDHLTYLLGYHYELSGDEETAVATYLSLIQQAPASPWSWLAWARLKPVEE